MATSTKKKLDEKNLKTLRDMVTLVHNKQCFDCNQKGPTYVNMTIGSFVCTSCSGLLRGLNPPHRIKSISMASFTTEEIEFLKKNGNELCRKVWLHAREKASNPNANNEAKFREFLSQKYERKCWYLPASDEMHEEARRHNIVQEEKPVTPKMKVSKSASTDSTATVISLAAIIPTTVTASVATSVSSSVNLSLNGKQETMPISGSAQLPEGKIFSAAADSKASTAVTNAFNDFFGADDFAQTATSSSVHTVAAVSETTTDDDFADFASFDRKLSIQDPAVTISQTSSTQAAPSEVPSVKEQNVDTQPKRKSNAASDKYAALAELDSVFGSGSNTMIDWDGNWGGSSVWQAKDRPPAGNLPPVGGDGYTASTGMVQVADGFIQQQSSPHVATAPGTAGSNALFSPPSANLFMAPVTSSVQPSMPISPYGFTSQGQPTAGMVATVNQSVVGIPAWPATAVYGTAGDGQQPVVYNMPGNYSMSGNAIAPFIVNSYSIPYVQQPSTAVGMYSQPFLNPYNAGGQVSNVIGMQPNYTGLQPNYTGPQPNYTGLQQQILMQSSNNLPPKSNATNPFL